MKRNKQLLLCEAPKWYVVSAERLNCQISEHARLTNLFVEAQNRLGDSLRTTSQLKCKEKSNLMKLVTMCDAHSIRVS